MAEPRICDILRQTEQALLPACGDAHEAAQQARLLLCHALKTDLLGLLLRKAEPFPMARAEELRDMVFARQDGVPLQYILGEWEFMGLPFYVGPGVLIPRQDTECLCEAALILAGERECETALDLCCGTGCLGVSLARRGGLRVTLADISPLCLDYARRNAARNGVKAETVQSDLLQGISGRYDLILCNPPYIPRGELAGLQREVRREPVLALDGGEDGLDFYRRLAAGYAERLTDKGALLLEVGAGQARDVISLFGGGRSIRDLNGVERVVLIEAKGEE